MELRNKSVKANMVMNSILTMSSFVFPLITFPYISRILLPVGTGKINFATSVISYFSMFAQLGIPTYGIRACAKVRDDKEELSRNVHELMIINLFMCIIVYVTFVSLLFVIPKFKEEKTLLIIISLSILLNAIGVEWLYKALEQYSYITIRSIAFKFIAVVGMLLFVHNQKDYIIYGFISIFAASASNVLNFINLRKIIYIRPLGGYKFKKHFKMILMFMSMSVATTIYTNLDNVMLGFMKTDDDVGYYGAAVKIKNILISLVASVSAVLLPRASYYVDKGFFEEFYSILKKTMHFIVLVALPTAVYFIIYAKEGIYFLSGDNYANSIVPMQIIMPTLIFVGMTNIIGIQMLVPLGKEKQVLDSAIAGAITNLLLNIIFIPRYASIGAAIATLVAEIVVLLWQFTVIRKEPIDLYEDIKWWKIAVALVLGILISIWTKKILHNNFIILVVSASLFFGVYVTSLLTMKENLVKELVEQLLFSKMKGRNFLRRGK